MIVYIIDKVMMLYSPMSDLEKCKKFIVSEGHDENIELAIKSLDDNDPINLLIKASYGLADCEKLRNNKSAFNEKFLHLYGYLIVAIHRTIFEQGGKCTKELLEIANYLEPYDSDSRKIRDFYNEVYERLIKENGKNYENNVYEIYNKFKTYIENNNEVIKDLLSTRVIKTILGYMGVRDIVTKDELDDLFEPKTYVDFNKVDTPTIEEAVKYLGYIPIESMADDRTILNYYKSFAKKIKVDIDQINRETWNIKLLKFRLGLVKWFKKHYKLISYIIFEIAGSLVDLIGYGFFLKFVGIHYVWIILLGVLIVSGLVEPIFDPSYSKKLKDWLEARTSAIEKRIKVVKNEDFYNKISAPKQIDQNQSSIGV
ncbi:MAG: hypothetical protein RXR51_05590 [Nitrososphaeria archaeon]